MDDPIVAILFGIIVVLAMAVLAMIKLTLHQSIIIKNLREKVNVLNAENSKHFPKQDQEVIINEEGGFTIVEKGETCANQDNACQKTD